MTTCKRCGQCCEDCPNLIKHKKLTSCRIYANRLGFKWKDKICISREETAKKFKKKYEGCPFNVEEKFPEDLFPYA